MIWTAALYFTASPNATSSVPMFLLTVEHAPSAAQAAPASRMRLEDMAVILLKADRLFLAHPAGTGRRRGRHDERRGRGRNAGVGPAEQQQIGVVGRPDAV